MDILPQLQTSLNFVTFMANLIDLRQFNTIFVLHDQTSRNEITLLIEKLPSRCEVAWLLLHEYGDPKHWNHSIYQEQNLLILIALQSKNEYSTLVELYVNERLNKRSRASFQGIFPNWQMQYFPH